MRLFLQKAPFIRLLIPLLTGIIVQWYYPLTIWQAGFLAVAGVILLLSFLLLRLAGKIFCGWIFGVGLFFLLVVAGAFLVQEQTISNNKKWFGHATTVTAYLLVLEEPLIPKQKTWKATAKVKGIISGTDTLSTRGKAIIYFAKDSTGVPLDYGSQLIINKPLQEISNAGNPGGFDYARYCLFNGITHQVFLKKKEYVLLDKKEEKWLGLQLVKLRKTITGILQQYIPGSKEAGLAEALLIGFKDNLDKPLVESYTNTGVIHIIAISGLHLGMIYALLTGLLKPVRITKYLWVKPAIIIAVLWLFSLLAGGQASILRSAVMFSCLVTGDLFGRKNNGYNALAASAFILLCYNPFYWWDVGFQLSYAAVLSIMLFMKPIEKIFTIQNKWLAYSWSLCAVTIAAQILTTPVSIYHFKQFPVHFVLANLIAVPLSGLILYGEMLLLAVSFIPVLAQLTGYMLHYGIYSMNSFIEWVEKLPGALWEGLSFTMPQLICSYLFITGWAIWFYTKRLPGAWLGMLSLLLLFALRSFSFWKESRKIQVVVYNVPDKTAIDFITGRDYFFWGNEEMKNNDFLQNFFLKPSRIKWRLNNTPQELMMPTSFSFGNKHIWIADSSFRAFPQTDTIHLLLVTQAPALRFSPIATSVHIQQVVLASSVPAWKAAIWSRELDSLQIPFHNVSKQQAYVYVIK